MQILPVIDLKDGEVVRGVAGERATYQGVESLLASVPSVAAVATAFANQLPVDTVYVADLDAISGHEPGWQSLDEIRAAGLEIWLDAGVGDLERANQLVKYERRQANLTGLIIGLESVPDIQMLQKLWESIGRERAIFSLDLKQGRPLTTAAGWDAMSAEQIADCAVQIGFRRLIVLDLAAVGMGQGNGAELLCRRLSDEYPQVEWISGGGVRGLADLKRLAEHGCSAALVASALHDGRLTADEVKQAQLY